MEKWNRWNQAILLIALLVAGTFTYQNCSPAKYSEIKKKCQGASCDTTPLNLTYSWKYDTQWSACTKTCGGGQQTRAVWCEDSKGAVVEDNLCGSQMPPEARECNIHSCSGSTYYWLPGAWSDCVNDNQTRTVACYDGTTGQPEADETKCTEAKPAGSRSCKNTVHRTYVQDLPPSQNQVDVLLVLDDSSSMTPDHRKLAMRFGSFAQQLSDSGMDWRACYTTTDVDYYQGAPLLWRGHNSHILTPAKSNFTTVFQDSIESIGSGFSNDEQGIKATYLAVEDNANHGCFRTDAALAVVLISDEDERSVGGLSYRSSTQYRALEEKNYPENLRAFVKSTFGSKKRFNYNSIIVRDSACEALQDQQESPSFIGYKYGEISNLTGGYVGDICAADYTENLRYFQDSINITVSQIDLGCAPISSSIKVTVAPAIQGLSYQVSGSKMSFSPVIPGGSRLVVEYICQ